jgi:hypothetical protein
MIEGSACVSLTNESGARSGRTENIWILPRIRIRIRNTGTDAGRSERGVPRMCVWWRWATATWSVCRSTPLAATTAPGSSVSMLTSPTSGYSTQARQVEIKTYSILKSMFHVMVLIFYRLLWKPVFRLIRILPSTSNKYSDKP